MGKIIEVNHLCKSYGNIQAVNNIDFYVERGGIFAFLGPNGAGKSTTIDMICTFLKPDSGNISVDNFILGKNDSEIRTIIGAVFQDGLLDDLLTVEENLKVRGGFYGLKGKVLKDKINYISNIVGITDLLKRPYGKLSGGQRRRCDIARGLIHTPKILFLDEPTTGLDPQTRKCIWETILNIQKESGMTVFLTTHYMEEASIADFVILIDKGEIVAKGAPSELKEVYAKDKLILTGKNLNDILHRLDERRLPYKVVANTVEIIIEKTMDALPILEEFKEFVTGFEVVKGTMDDVFIAITGKEIRE